MPCYNNTTQLTEIQVLWELQNGTEVWWDADVTAMRLIAHGELEGAAATLKYRASFGYQSTTSRVIFLNDAYLREEKGPDDMRMSWRPRRRQHKRANQILSSRGPTKRTQSDLRDEVDVLRRKLTRTMDKVTVLQREMELSSSVFHARPKNDMESETRAKNVLAFVRRRLALLLQRPPRCKTHPPSSQGVESVSRQGKEGIAIASIRTYVDCDLHSFEQISRMINTSQRDRAGGILFSPSYEMTQMPRQGTQCMSIFFTSFGELCNSVGLHSVADRVQMMRTYGTSRGEGVMRLLGTYEFDKEEEKKPTYLLIGKSCGRRCPEIVDGGNEGSAKFPVLKRATRVWNIVDRRYESSLELQWHHQRELNGQACSFNGETAKGCFQLIWRKAPELRMRDWSRCLTNEEVIIGKLEAVLPCVIITGSVLCDEFTSLLPDEVMKDSVQ